MDVLMWWVGGFRYVVCEYYPAGNVVGNFTMNVQAAASGSSSVVSAGSADVVGGLCVWLLLVGWGIEYHVL